MTLIDREGRLFGRFNLVDTAVVLAILVLIPLGYATYLLFRPATPRIESVTQAAISKEEERISVGGKLVAKFKVRGSGFTPMLRARIDDADALAFVFESPTSADLLVGPVSPGPHDLILRDGVQDVARANGAISISSTPASGSLRAFGWLTGLGEEQANSITVGLALPENDPAYRVLALGPLMPGFRQIALAGSTIEVPAPGTYARKAALLLTCTDAHVPNPCTLDGRPDYRVAPLMFPLVGPKGSFRFEIDEVLTPEPPTRATLHVRLTNAGAFTVRVGDRDDLLDERVATISSVSGDALTLDAGVDKFHDGWHYRSQRLVPGAPFVLKTDRYELRSILQSVDVKAAQP